MTLSSPAIVELAKRSFVCIKVNVDVTRELINRYKIEDLPTLVFLSRHGVELSRMANDYNNRADKVLESMARAAKLDKGASAEVDKLLERIAADPTLVGPRMALAEHYREGRQIEAARAAYHAAYEVARDKGALADVALRRVIWCDMKLRRFADAKAGIERFLAGYKSSDYVPHVLYYRGLAEIHHDRDKVKAKATFEELLRRFPEHRYARSARKAISRHCQ